MSWCFDEEAYNFALYSKHATSVRLLLFGDDDVSVPRLELALDPLIHKSGRVWHCRVAASAAPGCRYYGYCVDGPAPAGPFEVHAFHPKKLLLDPYARCIAFPPAFDRNAALDELPNLGKAPLGMITACETSFDWGAGRRPRHEADAVIYELHVRGFTQHASSGVSESARGTFSGVIDKIPYLRELGVNVVELMPVFQFDPQAGDYWGYNPINFFATHRDYAARGSSPIDSFRAMVSALHEADIEVVLDVVYNHTGEGGAGGPVYSFKGMLRAGDEFLATQGGNNNPYNQDNETSWLDWRRRDDHAGFFRFVQQMIAFRKQHRSLSRSRFWRDDVRWFGPRDVVDLSSRAVALRLRGASQGDRDLYLMINGDAEPVPFVIQDIGEPWRVVADTARPSPDDIDITGRHVLARPSYVVEGRSVVVLMR